MGGPLGSAQRDRSGREEISRRLARPVPPDTIRCQTCKRMTMPGLWLFGSADDKTPVQESVAVLDQLRASRHDITVRVFPDAGHGLLDVPPTAPAAPTTLITWIEQHVT
jgi:pimeloyl-ACP methyl ester carboxylesterase